MHHGLLGKNSLIIGAIYLIIAALILFLIVKIRKDLIYRIIAIEHKISANELIPQGQFRGLDIGVIHQLFGKEEMPEKFIYNKESARGVSGLIPKYYLGHEICVLYFRQSDGGLYIWYIEGNNEIIWDAFIEKGLHID